MKKILFLLFCFIELSISSQTNKPNSFRDYKLGLSFEKFSEMKVNQKNSSYIQLEFNEIKYDGMDLYDVENQVSKSGDHIDLTLGFYNKKLALIVVGYHESYKDILDGLIGKYGNFTRSNKNEYYNPLGGNTIVINNFYWDRFPSCKLSLYYNYTSGLTQVLFADKVIQKEIRIKQQQQNKKKVE